MKLKKIYFWGVKKAKISLKSPKTEFGSNISMTYPSIGKFTWIKKNNTFGGQKAENKPLSPKMELRPQKIKHQKV
jgi:hypothetical protein